MLEPQDIQKLIEVLASKDDFRGIEKKLDSMDGRLIAVESQLNVLSQTVVLIEDGMTVLEEKQDQINFHFR